MRVTVCRLLHFVRRALAPGEIRWLPILVLAPLLSVSAQALGEDLLELYRLALSSDPEYLGAGSANRAIQELRPQARALLLPEASASGAMEHNEQQTREAGNIGGIGTVDFQSRSFSISLTQPIYRRDLLIGLYQADSQIRQANAEYGFALQDLMLRVAESYFGVLSAQDDLEFLRSERNANDQQLKQSQQRFEVGLIAITDVEEAKAGFDLANAQVIGAENDLDNAREALREITGRYLTVLAPLGDTLRLIVPEPDDIDAWTETAMVQNLELTGARIATETAREEISRQQAFHLPTLDVIAQHNRSTAGGRFGDSDITTTSVGVQVNIPIYQGGEVLSRTRAARHEHQRTLDDLERQRRITQRQARDAFRGVSSGISQVQALAQAVVSTKAALEAIEAGFQVGTRTSVDVLNAQRDLFRAKRDLSQSRYDYILDILRLKQAAGTFNEEDLAEVNRWLN